MYHDGDFIYRQRKTDNRHTEQVAHVRFHPRDRFPLSPCTVHFCDNWISTGRGSRNPPWLARFFFKRWRIGNVMIGRDQLIGEHASSRPRARLQPRAFYNRASRA